jgi:thymidylate kinase
MSGEYPMVVLEGLDGVGKSTVAKALAERLGATLLCSPGGVGALALDNLGPLRMHFDACAPVVRREFYRFANVTVSERANALLKSGPVVVDRYWASTVAYALAMDGLDVNDGRVAGEYPAFLRRPDAVVLVTASSADRRQRRAQRDGADGTTEERRLDGEAGLDERLRLALQGWATVVVQNRQGALEATVEEVVSSLGR